MFQCDNKNDALRGRIQTRWFYNTKYKNKR